MDSIKWVGLDVHKETIAVAVANAEGPARSVGTIPNEPTAVTRLVRQLGADGHWAYEAGPCGYDLYRQLTAQRVTCSVVAPTLLPVRVGDRVKTDRRDALKLASLLRSGELTAVWVPTVATEALRDLVRARYAAQQDAVRARHRLLKFLLRPGRRPPAGVPANSQAWWAWLPTVTYPQAPHTLVHETYLDEVLHQRARVTTLDAAIAAAVATAPGALPTVIAGLQALHGIGLLTAATLTLEVGRFDRFRSPRALMAYWGVVPREHSSGGHTRRGAITKTGNALCRHVLIEAAWHARRPAAKGGHVTRRLAVLPVALRPLARRARARLHPRYRHLVAHGKTSGQAVTAVARELVGFIWALGVALERAAA